MLAQREVARHRQLDRRPRQKAVRRRFSQGMNRLTLLRPLVAVWMAAVKEPVLVLVAAKSMDRLATAIGCADAHNL